MSSRTPVWAMSLCVVAVLVAVSLISGGPAVTRAAAHPRAATTPMARPGAFPRYDHVFMLTEENHGFQDIIGNPEAPTLNNLVPTPALGGSGGTGGFGGVTVTGDGQAWAVGAYTTASSANRALIERWITAG